MVTEAPAAASPPARFVNAESHATLTRFGSFDVGESRAGSVTFAKGARVAVTKTRAAAGVLALIAFMIVPKEVTPSSICTVMSFVLTLTLAAPEEAPAVNLRRTLFPPVPVLTAWIKRGPKVKLAFTAATPPANTALTKVFTTSVSCAAVMDTVKRSFALKPTVTTWASTAALISAIVVVPDTIPMTTAVAEAETTETAEALVNVMEGNCPHRFAVKVR